MKIVSLGKITSTTPGTPIKLSATKVTARALFLLPLQANTGLVLIGDSGLVRATLVGSYVGDGLPKGVPFDLTGEMASLVGKVATIDLSRIMIDVFTSGDGVGGYYIA
jgi:hypothetical protein